jgi:hypothetical protein
MIISGGDVGKTVYYQEPSQYAVRKTGYYCVGTSELCIHSSSS